MNDIIATAQRNRFGYGAFKKKHTRICEQAIQNARIRPIEGSIAVSISWFEKDARRDPDNIQAGSKFILDALVNMKVIPNDTQRFIKSIFHRIYIDKLNPRIIVALYDCV